jgi:hypothetical protein
MIEHPPAATTAEHTSPVFAATVTVPVGNAAPDTPLTLTLILTGLPGAAGFGEIEVITVELAD